VWMLHRFICVAAGANVLWRALLPAELDMSRGACGPNPWQMSSAASGVAPSAKIATALANQNWRLVDMAFPPLKMRFGDQV